jgi:hypothetical protein
VNDRIVELGEPLLLDASELLWLICECPNDDCTKAMRMAPAEYEELRAASDLYAVVPGHECRETEEIVGATERYVLVRPLRSRVGPGIAA